MLVGWLAGGGTPPAAGRTTAICCCGDAQRIPCAALPAAADQLLCVPPRVAAPPRRQLAEQHGWSLAAWRRSVEKKGDKAFVEGFAELDAGGGSGWDLLCNLIQCVGCRRPPACPPACLPAACLPTLSCLLCCCPRDMVWHCCWLSQPASANQLRQCPFAST